MAVQLNPRGEVLNATRKSQILLKLYCGLEIWVHGGVQATYNNTTTMSYKCIITYNLPSEIPSSTLTNVLLNE